MSLWTFIRQLTGLTTKPRQVEPTPQQVRSAAGSVEVDHHSSKPIVNEDTIKVSGRPYHRTLKVGGRRVELFADIYDEERTNYWVIVQKDHVRYLFSPEEHRWSYHGTPIETQAIEEAMLNALKDFAPKPWTANFKSVYRRGGKTVYSIRGEAVDQNGAVKVVRGSVTTGPSILEGCVGQEAHDRGNSFSMNLDSQQVTIGGRLTYMKGPLHRWLASEIAIFHRK
jgi:hypothetical protein